MADVTISTLGADFPPLGIDSVIPISNGYSTNKVTVGNFLANAFGSQTTIGVLDWNDVSNTKPGCCNNTLLLANHTNGPGVGGYYHPLNFEYSTKMGDGNVTQMAVAYGTPGNELCMRGRYSGSWSTWVRFLNNSNYSEYALPKTSPQIAKAWLVFSGFTNSTAPAAGSNISSKILSQYNISSLSYVSGNTLIATFTNSFPNANLCVVGNSTGNNQTYNFVAAISTTTTTVTFALPSLGGSGAANVLPTGNTSIIVYSN